MCRPRHPRLPLPSGRARSVRASQCPAGSASCAGMPRSAPELEPSSLAAAASLARAIRPRDHRGSAGCQRWSGPPRGSPVVWPERSCPGRAALPCGNQVPGPRDGSARGYLAEPDSSGGAACSRARSRRPRGCAPALGLVHGVVRPRNQLVGVLARTADGDPMLSVTTISGGVSGAGRPRRGRAARSPVGAAANLLGYLDGGSQAVHAGQYDQELVAAHARDQVVGGDRGPDAVGDGAQDRVAAACPCWSLMILKLSISTNITAAPAVVGPTAANSSSRSRAAPRFSTPVRSSYRARRSSSASAPRPRPPGEVPPPGRQAVHPPPRRPFRVPRTSGTSRRPP